MIPLDQLELILKQLQPNFDLSKPLAGLPQTQQTPTSAQPAPLDMPEPRNEEKEEVYSGATVPLGDDDDEEEKDCAGSKPVGEESLVPMEVEPVTMEAQSIPGKKEREVEQQPMVEEGAQEGLAGEEKGEIQMPPDEGKIGEVIELSSGKEEARGDAREGESRVKQEEEQTEKEAGGRSEGHAESASGTLTRRQRRILEDEPMEDEEEQPFFLPIDEILTERQPEREVPAPVQHERRILSMAEKERLQRERRRKGKEPERPAKKKRSRLTSTTVRIQEPQAEGARRQQQQEDSDEEAPLVW